LKDRVPSNTVMYSKLLDQMIQYDYETCKYKIHPLAESTIVMDYLAAAESENPIRGSKLQALLAAAKETFPEEFI